MPKLTIGMAHHEDYDGVYFTLQSLRLFHPEVMKDVEFVIVDNSPNGVAAKDVRNMLGAIRNGTAGAKYIAMPEKSGTTQTRERIFAEASGDAVLVCDCHVLFAPGSIARLLRYYDEHPECNDLLSGPLLMDDMHSTCTHFNHFWRSQMLGTWGSAWQCPCGHTHFSIVDGPGGTAEYRALEGDGDLAIAQCGHDPSCCILPVVQVADHVPALLTLGCKMIGTQPDDAPFEIPAQGLGSFSCRKAAWLGFNPLMRGFGGEEHYIHAKFRQAGRKCICLPFLRWVHRFGRPGGPKYNLQRNDKVRNYIIGHTELKWDLAPIKEHFGVPDREWETLVEQSMHPEKPMPHAGGGCGTCKNDIARLDLEHTYDYFRKRPTDFNEHYPKIRECAEKCTHVTEIGQRDYGLIPLLAAKPKTLRVYNAQRDGAGFWKAEQLAAKHSIDLAIRHDDTLSVDLEETDLLWIDGPVHTDERLTAELARHASKVRRFIILHDTELYGIRGMDGKPGLKAAVIRFMREHKEWSVVFNDTRQSGLMVLSRNPEDKPKRPSIFQMGPTFVKHLAEHVADGVKSVDEAQYQARLEECWLCDMRTHDSQCGLCGCPLLAKAKWRSSYCDANKWVGVDAMFSEGATNE